MTDLDAAISRLPVIGILRGCPPEYVADVAAAACAAGLAALEVTLDSTRPFDAIELIAGNHPDVSVGAGTVRSVEDVAKAVDAGARFIVSPHHDPAVVSAAAAASVASIPGAATPTEVWAALRDGAALVKLFPARELGGPAYVGAILGPLGRPRLVPTGGVDAGNAADYLAAGAAAVGVGGSVFARDLLASGNASEVGLRCRRLVESVR